MNSAETSILSHSKKQGNNNCSWTLLATTPPPPLAFIPKRLCTSCLHLTSRQCHHGHWSVAKLGGWWWGGGGSNNSTGKLALYTNSCILIAKCPCRRTGKKRSSEHRAWLCNGHPNTSTAVEIFHCPKLPSWLAAQLHPRAGASHHPILHQESIGYTHNTHMHAHIHAK